MSISMRMRIVGSAKNQKMEKRCTVIVHCVWMCFFVVVMVQEHVVVRLWLGILTATTTTPGHVWSGLAGCWLFPSEPRFVRYKLFCASLTTAILRTSQNNRQYVKHSMFRRRRRGCRQIVGVCVCVCNSLWCLFTEMLLMEHVSNFKMFTNWLRSSAWGSFMFLFHCPAPPLSHSVCYEHYCQILHRSASDSNDQASLERAFH